MMDIRHLKYFLEVAKECHFTRAAQALHVSQPTLSQQIGQLEKEIGAQLFDRAGKKVRLTPAGALFCDYARRAVREMESARVALDELDGLKRGEVSVGVVQTVNSYLVPEIAARFGMAHPGVTLRVEELAGHDIEMGLQEGRLNLGIGFVPAEEHDIESHPLFEEELVLAVAPSHPLAARSEVTVGELDGEAMVLMSPAFCTRRLWDEAARAVSIVPRIVVEMNSIEGIVATVRAGNAATVLPALALSNEESRPDGLRVLHLLDPTPRRRVGLLWHSTAYRCTASRAFSGVTIAVVEHNLKTAASGHLHPASRVSRD
jgi:LysR family transcriptional regulator, cyn operon transcriptional activator